MILFCLLCFLAVRNHWPDAERSVYGPYLLMVAVIFSPFQFVAASYEVGLWRDLVFTRQSFPLLSWHIICTLLAMLLFVPVVIAILVLSAILPNIGS